jgi:hypothetical protein
MVIPFPQLSLARIADSAPSLNGYVRSKIFNWPHISIRRGNPNRRSPRRLVGICFEARNRGLIYPGLIYLVAAMSKTLLLLALMLLLAGCGSTTPCDDSDPVGICANAHRTVPTGT